MYKEREVRSSTDIHKQGRENVKRERDVHIHTHYCNIYNARKIERREGGREREEQQQRETVSRECAWASMCLWMCRRRFSDLSILGDHTGIRCGFSST